jgi:molybdate transport system permease protein
MVGGNIPGETRVISIAIYDHVESLDYATAHQMSIVLVVFAFAILFSMFLLNRRLLRR